MAARFNPALGPGLWAVCEPEAGSIERNGFSKAACALGIRGSGVLHGCPELGEQGHCPPAGRGAGGKQPCLRGRGTANSTGGGGSATLFRN